ncbi:MAG: uroporphyrinogen decarboxylase family protein [Ruminococcus sp.]
MEEKAKKLYEERIKIMDDAIAMKEPERIPVAPFLASVVQRLEGSSYRDLYYDYDRAGQAAVDFYTKYPVDACTGCRFTSGKAQEISGINIIDWPGQPGTKISIHSSHQVHEIEYLTPEECYETMLKDFDGFYLRHYIPRVFEGLKGLESLTFSPATILSTGGGLGPMLNPEFLETIDKLKQISEYDAQAAAKSAEWSAKIEDLGIPKLFTGGGEVPFDVISDYFRTTLPAMTDLFEYETEIIELCNLIADRQIASWKYFETAPMPVKRVFFPLHKAMDGFMSPKQFEKVYMGPYMKMLDYLLGIGVTPFIFTEGPYNSRLDQLAEMLPKGCLVSFETVDMKRAKETVGKNNCITGNLSLYTLEFGTKEETIEQTKELIDICAPGGGYIFGASGCVENAKRENLEAMLETLDTYGRR